MYSRKCSSSICFYFLTSSSQTWILHIHLALRHLYKSQMLGFEFRADYSLIRRPRFQRTSYNIDSMPSQMSSGMVQSDTAFHTFPVFYCSCPNSFEMYCCRKFNLEYFLASALHFTAAHVRLTEEWTAASLASRSIFIKECMHCSITSHQFLLDALHQSKVIPDCAWVVLQKLKNERG